MASKKAVMRLFTACVEAKREVNQAEESEPPRNCWGTTTYTPTEIENFNRAHEARGAYMVAMKQLLNAVDEEAANTES